MPSVIQKKYYNHVKVFWLKKDLLIKKINRCIDVLVEKKPEIKKIIVFGSMAEDNCTTFSDIDLILIVSKSRECFIDRSLTYIDFFNDIGLNVDIFVYTEEEVERNNIPLLKTALARGKVLFER